MVTLLVTSGFDLDFVIDLDLERFNAVVESTVRVKYRDKTEEAWTRMIAAQGSSKDMKKIVKAWAPAIGAAPDDHAEFHKRVGGGF